MTIPPGAVAIKVLICHPRRASSSQRQCEDRDNNSSKIVNVSSEQNDLKLVGNWLQSGQLKIDLDDTHAFKNIEDAIMCQEHLKRVKSCRVVIKVEEGW